MSMAKATKCNPARTSSALVSPHQPPRTDRPAKTALHHPAPRQQYKAFRGLRQFHHYPFETGLLCGVSGLFTRVPLVHKGPFFIADSTGMWHPFFKVHNGL